MLLLVWCVSPSLEDRETKIERTQYDSIAAERERESNLQPGGLVVSVVMCVRASCFIHCVRVQKVPPVC